MNHNALSTGPPGDEFIYATSLADLALDTLDGRLLPHLIGLAVLKEIFGGFGKMRDEKYPLREAHDTGVEPILTGNDSSLQEVHIGSETR
jgi:hypothetical protein